MLVFDWLFEGRAAVYLTLAVVALLLVALWWRDRRRHWLYAIVVVGLLAAVYLLLDFAVETRREQITRRLMAIESAVKAGNAEKVMEQISPKFRYGTITRDQFRNAVVSRLKDRFVEDLTIWEVRVPDASGKVTFKAKPKGSFGENPGFQVRAEFVQDPDGNQIELVMEPK